MDWRAGGEEEERRGGGASVSDKVRDERDAGRKRQRGGTRGKWRCGAVVGAGAAAFPVLSVVRAGGWLPPASRPHPLGSSAAAGSWVRSCACAGAAAVAVPVRVRVRRVGPRFLPAIRVVPVFPRGDGLSRESPWTFGT